MVSWESYGSSVAAGRAGGPWGHRCRRSNQIRAKQQLPLHARGGCALPSAPAPPPRLPRPPPHALRHRPGTAELNGTTVNFVKLAIANLTSVDAFAAACPGGDAALPTAVPLAQATLNVTIFYNVSANITLPYGDGEVAVPAGGIKWNVDAAGW